MTPTEPALSGKVSDLVPGGGWRSFLALLIIQGQNAFNDNFVKFILISLTLALPKTPWLGENPQFTLSLLIPLPFILLAPVAGFMADRYSKRSNIRFCLALQLVLFAAILWSLSRQILSVAVIGFFLLSVQSVFFSPAKQGVLKEYLGANRLSFANGLMLMVTIVSSLAGIWLGGTMFAHMRAGGHGIWESAFHPALWVGSAALVPLLLSFFLAPTDGHPEVHFTTNLAWSHFSDLTYVFANRTLRFTALGITFFWLIAYFMGVVTVNFGLELYPDQTTGQGAAAGANMSAILGVGMIIGTILVSILSRHHIELGMVPLGGIGMGLSLGALGFFHPSGAIFHTCLCLVGITGAFYITPLTAKLQEKADESWRGRVLSAEGLLTSTAGFLAILLGMVFTISHLPAAWQVIIFAVPSILLSVWIIRLVPKQLLRFVLLGLFRRVYQVKALNPEHMPESGGVLLVANHVSYIDSFILTTASPRPIRFLIFEDFFKVRAIAWFLRLFRAIAIRPNKAKDAIVATAEGLKEGDVVCIFPEGQLSRTGVVNELRRGFEVIARKANAPVLPVYMDRLWGSIFTFERGRYFYKWPLRLRYPVTVAFGDPIPAGEVTDDRLRRAFQDLSVKAVSNRPEARRSVERAIVQGLKSTGNVYIEHGRERHVWPRRRFLASALALAARWRRTLPPESGRVGILLPSGPAAALMHLGVRLAGRVSVAVPLKMMEGGQLDVEWLERALRVHGLETVITSRVFSESLVNLLASGSPVRLLDMAEELTAVSARLLGERVLSWIEPSALTCLRFGFPRQHPEGQDKPAVAWIHDTSSAIVGDIPITVLSQQNLLSQEAQLTSANFLASGECVFSEAQYHTVLGNVLSLWYPVLQRGTVVSRSFGAKIDPGKFFTAVAADPVDAVVLTNMLRAQIRGGPDGVPWTGRPPARFFCFESGLDAEMELSWEADLGLPICRGWAPEALGALVSLSLVDPHTDAIGHTFQRGRKAGSQGLLLPGIAVRVENEKNKLTEPGVLHFSGPCFPSVPLPGVILEGSFDGEGFLTVADPQR